MSLERRISQMRQESGAESSPYSLIASELKKDSSRMHALFQKSYRGRNGGSFADPIDAELVDVYELRPADLPTLSLPNNLSFVAGFNYVASQWYPLIRAVASGVVAPDKEHFMDSHLERMFPDGRVTTQQLRDALSVDPSGATWLEKMARVEFREGNLELTGVRKAITGIRKMYEALTAAK